MTGLVRRYFHGCLICGLLLAAALPLARDSAAAPLTLRFNHLGTEQGLTQESVLSVLQDSHGYMWMGTQAGLNRYDGYRVTTFKNDPANPLTLLDNYVVALFEDARGQLWIGSRGGLDRYDPASRTFVHVLTRGGAAGAAGNLTVADIVGDGAQGIWLATSEGLQHVDTVSGQVRTLRHDAADSASLGDDKINALRRDRRGNLWIGTASGLDLLPAGATSFQHLAGAGASGPGKQIGTILKLSLGADDILWAGTLTGLQAWRLDGPQPQPLDLTPADGLQGQRISSLLHDREDVLWVGTFGDGLKRRDARSGHFYHYRHDGLNRRSVGDNQISSLYQDRTGTLWVGSWYAGVDWVDLASGGFETYTEYAGALPSIANQKVRAIAGAGGNLLWLGTGEGLIRLDLAKGTTELWRQDPRNPAGLPGDQVMTLDTDRRNRLWIGTSSGLGWRDPVSGAITRVPLGADAAGNYIQHILVDRAGVIWVASRINLHRIDPDTGAMQSYAHDPKDGTSRADGRLFTLFEDRRGNFWVGTENGLDRLDRASGTFRHYRHDPGRPGSLSHNRVHAFFEDAKGRLWIGTAGGLCEAMLDAAGEPHFRFFAPNDRRAPDPIGAIKGDKSGRLWISTTAGISLFDPVTEKFKDYTSKDGTIDGSYFIGASYQALDGTLYFGGQSGMTAFQPAQIHDNPYPPQVSLLDFAIFNQSILSGAPRTDVLAAGPIYAARSLTLSHRDAVFSFEFAGLHYADPQRNRYAYQLEGFDPSWVTTDAGKRYATYTNLDPGRYVFRVKASNKDGLWGEQATALEVVIVPPFWKTWWFRLLMVAVVLGGAYGTLRIRVRMLVRQKRDLELEVGTRTHELVLQKESVERQKHEVERQKESVELAHRNISQLSDIGRRITANLDSEAIMAMLYQQVHELMDATVFGIGIYRPELALIEYPFAMENGKRYRPYTRSMRDPSQLAVWCVAHAKDVFINNLRQEYRNYISNLDRLSGMGDMGVLEDDSVPVEPCSVIYVPISLGGRVRGLITVHSYRAQAYQRIDLDMLNTLASYVAVAFDNADAYRQLKDTQLQLVEREKLAALGSLVAGVAHELNTPIGNSLVVASTLEDETLQIASKNNADTMRRSDLTRFIDTAKDASALLMRSLRSAAELVNSFKQVAVDQASAKRRHFNLHQATQEIITTVASQIRKAGHSIELDMPADITMDSFPGPYGQVIINLVNNALLHAFEYREDGLILLSAVRTAPDRVRVVFQDDGAGIPIENLARIFDPFFTTKFGQGGNGLGLNITYNIVTSLLDGHIRVESIIGIGTTFTIDLPLTASLAGD